MKFPCKEKKCILYPVCRNKESIYCKQLEKYYRHIFYSSKNHTRIWEKLNEHLPNLERIKNEGDV